MRSKVLIIFLITAVVVGCNKDEGISVPLQNEVNEFVWFSMNSAYYWVDEVDDLSFDNYETYSELYAFLNEYSDPAVFFDDLLVDQDRFSWIVDDYDELEAAFQGTGESFGYELGLLRLSSNSNNLLGYVKYTVPGGSAEKAGLKRGDAFLKVNGTSLTVDNYNSLLFGSSSYTVTLAERQEGSFVSTQETVSLVSEVLTENPILISKILETGGVKVGYLLYNQFIKNNTYHLELNDVFGNFNNEGISDLVLDLRYNGGGSLFTSRILASMLYSNASENDVLGSIIYNDRLEDFDTDINFLTTVPTVDSNDTQIGSTSMNRLNINRIFILTSGSTASASEFVIAGLLPYMDVTVIGTKTVGKNVGSTTIYDSDDGGKSSSLNPNHTYAIQPIISQLSNSVGFTDYIDGLEPNIEVNEVDYLGNLLPLGDPSEPLLAEALAVITGVARTQRLPDSGMELININDGKEYLNTTMIDSISLLGIQ